MTARVKISAAQAAREAWGTELPRWVQVLAAEADATTEKATAIRIGYAASVVWQVIRRDYKGSYPNVESAVRAALMRDTVICPVLGEIAGDKCLSHQNRTRRPVNTTEVKLSRRCPTCPNRKQGGSNVAK
ncbi:transcriptional regulator [Oleomonas cavernae]|uniref:Transcriptional regulator n=1 Tax=Oleomonas cavernae TaxID=2320859 RepID=A0A418WUH7_9PROT|nr:transcriptional regulator [Oleomonas cavernae]RJF94836.1 transcriptional regulator [Oleomonas cavernae]